jgi:hypothetical protein
MNTSDLLKHYDNVDLTGWVWYKHYWKHRTAAVSPESTVALGAIIGPGCSVSGYIGMCTVLVRDVTVNGNVDADCYLEEGVTLIGSAGSATYIGKGAKVNANLNGSNVVFPGVELKTQRVGVRAIVRGALPLYNVPRLIGIHKLIWSKVQTDGLDMSSWHCGTRHCRAGWATHLAQAYTLEQRVGFEIAGALVYAASDPSLLFVPNFYDDNRKALEDIERCAL